MKSRRTEELEPAAILISELKKKAKKYGFLEKKSPNLFSGWQMRFCILLHDRLLYYEPQLHDNFPCGAMKGSIMASTIISLNTDGETGLNMTLQHRVFEWRARTRESRDAWFQYLRSAIKAANAPEDSPPKRKATISYCEICGYPMEEECQKCATMAMSVKRSAPAISSQRSSISVGSFEITLPNKIPLGFLRRQDQRVICHTVDASDEVITNIQVGDKLIMINDMELPEHSDFVKIMLASVKGGSLPYRLMFLRDDSAKDIPSLVAPPDFFDDPVAFFAYWDHDQTGLTMDDMIHAIAFSFPLVDDKKDHLRKGLEVLWPHWDPPGIGIDVMNFTRPDGLASFMMHPIFFELVDGKMFESDFDRNANLEGDKRPASSPDRLLGMFEDFKTRVAASNAAALQKQRTNSQRKAEKGADLSVTKKAAERMEKGRQQSIKNLKKAIQSRNVEMLEKQILFWKGDEQAPTDLLEQARRIVLEDAQAHKEARWREAENILSFASTNLKSRAGLARLEKALEQTAQVPEFDDSKWREIYKQAYARIGKILDACDRRKKVAANFLKEKSEDLDAMVECKTQLESALKAANAADLGEDVKEAELIRKKIHNWIQDVRGGTRVFCRVRPLADGEMDEICTKKSLLELIVKDDNHEKEELFMFDAVFDATNKQGDVFVDCEDLVMSTLDGYNVTIFAYGQTGSGKTFTMSGTDKEPGVVPRTIFAVYNAIAEHTELDVTVSGRMVELYNNRVVDLLGDLKEEGHKVRYDAKNNLVFLEPAAVSRDCTTAGEMTQLIHDGSQQRRTASTMMNAESSRSHLFTMISIASKSKDTGREVTGKITLIDLAGSERLKKSHVSGAGQLEAIEINKSLTALGDVISGLTAGKKRADIPYRNHKLTQMLQDALGGSSKTVMFVCARPDNANTDETLMSLRFAQRARNVINKKQEAPPASEKKRA